MEDNINPTNNATGGQANGGSTPIGADGKIKTLTDELAGFIKQFGNKKDIPSEQTSGQSLTQTDPLGDPPSDPNAFAARLNENPPSESTENTSPFGPIVDSTVPAPEPSLPSSNTQTLQPSEPSILNNPPDLAGVNSAPQKPLEKPKEESNLAGLREQLDSINTKASDLSESVKAALKEIDEMMGTDLSGEKSPEPAEPVASSTT